MGLLQSYGQLNCATGISVNPAASQQVCLNGTANQLVATITTAAGISPAPITYTWYSNSTNSTSGGTIVSGPVATTTSTTSSAFTPPTNIAGTLWYYCVVTNTDIACGSTTYTTTPVEVATSNYVTPSVNIEANPGYTICQGSTVTFVVQSSANVGTSPSYQWQHSTDNGSSWSTVGTSSTYTSSSLMQGEKIRLLLTPDGTVNCPSPAFATSNSITLTVNPVVTPSVIMYPSANPVCAGTNVTFTAEPTNGGTNPIFQWRLNGANVGGGGSTYQNSALNTGDQVTVVVTSGALCPSTATVTSAPVVMTVNPNLPVSVSLAATSTNICTGTSVTFTATPVNGGTSPTYQWRVNGVNQGTVTTSNTFSSATLNNNDVVSVVMNSNATPCATSNPATSNGITMTVNPYLPVSVSIAASATTICQGSSVTFTATPVNGGTTPAYQWKVNGVNAGTNSNTFTSTTLNNNDVVTVVLTSNSTPCATGSPAPSNSITMTVNAQSTLTLATAASTAAQTVCVNNPINNIAYAIGGGATSASITAGALPAGVTGNFSGGTFTISGTPSASGTFNYTVTTSGPCTNVSLSGSITVNANATLSHASGSTSQTVCTSSAIAAITYNVGGSATNVTVTGLPAGVSGTYNAGAGTFVISGSPTASGTFNYMVTTAGPCINPSLGGTIIVNPTVTPTVTLTASSSSICSSGSVTFTATATGGGSNPQYTWRLNGVAQTTTTTNTWTRTGSSLPNNGVITVTLTSNNPCATPTAVLSNSITMTISSGAPANWKNNENISPSSLTVCPPTTFSMSIVALSGATGYTWTMPAGFTITSGAGTNNITVAVSTAATSTTHTISVVATNACGQNAAKTRSVTVSDFAAVNVGNDTSVCVGGSVQLTATRLDIANTNVSWSVSPAGSGTFSVNNALVTIFTPSITPTTPTNITITGTPASVSGACTITADQLILTVRPVPTATISGTTTICSGSSTNITFNGTANTTVTYNINGGANQTIALGAGGSATLNTGALSATSVFNLVSVAYTSGNACTTPITGAATVTVNPAATANAGTAQTICAGVPFNLSGSIGGSATTSTWSAPSGSFANPNLLTTSFTPSASGSVVLTLTTNDPDGAGPCTAAVSTVTMTVNPAATVSAGSNMTICANSTATMAGSFGGAATSATWSTSGTGSFNNNLPTAIYTPSAADISTGTITLTYTTNDPDGAGPCSASSASITLTINPIPVVNAGINETICQFTTATAIPLAGASVSGGASTAAWSIVSGGGSLSSTAYTSDPASVTYTPDVNYAGNVVLQLLSADPAGPCAAVSATKTIAINPRPTVSAGADQTICGGSTAFMVGAFGGGATTATWSTSGSGTFSNNSPTAIYTPSAADIAAGSVTLTYTTNDPAGPCASVSASMVLTINPAAVINAGPNQNICSDATATMAATLGGSAISATWSTSGSGTFSNNSPTAVYTPSLSDIAAGSVVLTYTSNDPAGPCTAVSSSMTLTITRQAQINTQPANRAVCATFGVNLSVVAVGTNLNYQWYKGIAPAGVPVTNSANISGANAATLSFAQADPADAGQYYVVISGSAICNAITSQQANLHVDQKINITTQPISTAVCTGGNATFTVAASTANGDPLTYQWRFNGDDIPGAESPSFTITNATENESGIYDVVVTGPSGFTCASANSLPATLTVHPIPNVVATPNATTVCSYENLSIALTGGVPGTVYNWTVAQTGVTGGVSGSSATAINTGDLFAAGPADGTIIYTITPVANGCTGTPVAVAITVRPLPSGSISTAVGGSVAVCQNTGAPVITFTGTNGTAPYTFNYKINNSVTTYSVTTVSGNSVSVPAPTNVAGTFVYSLVSVADQATVGCGQAASGSATVIVNPTPSAAIAGTTTVCIGTANPTITFTGSNGTPNYTFGYTLNGVAQTPLVSNAAGIATLSAPTGVAGTFTYALTSVTDNSSTNCTQAQTGSAVVTITPNSTLTLTSAAGTNTQSVCINYPIATTTYLVGGSGTGANIFGLPPGLTGTYNPGTKVVTISGTPTVSGTFVYSITTTGPCGNVTVNGSIFIDSAPVGGTTANSTFGFGCAGSNGGNITVSGHNGNVVRWESSTNGGQTWTTINHTNVSYAYQNITTTTWYRAVIGKTLCTGLTENSTHTVVNVVPTTGAGAMSATSSPQFICSGSSTLTAVGYGQGTNPGSTLTGGEFDEAGTNLDGPGLWRKTLISDFDAQDKINIEGSTNNTRNSAFNLTNGPKTFDLAVGCTPITYNNNPLGGVVNNNKFMAVIGQNTSSLESPIFNLIGLTTASMDWWEAYDLKAGASITIEISFDAGATYNTTLRTITGPVTYGNPLDFAQTALDLTAYVGLSNLRVRFTYRGTGCSSWGLEMIRITKGSLPASYTWKLYDPVPVSGTEAQHYLNVFTNPSVVVTPPSPNTTNAPITYYYSLSSSAGGCLSDIQVTVNPTPTAAATSPGLICSGTTINVPISGTVIGTTFTWSRAANPNINGGAPASCNSNCTVINETLINTGTTAQTITYTIVPYYSNGGVSCPGVPVNIDVIIAAPVSTSLAASYTCNGGTGAYTANIQLDVQGEGAISGFLQPGNIPITGTAPGLVSINVPITGNTTYSISSLSVGGCAAPSLPAAVTVTLPTIGPAGLWVGGQDNDWFNRCNWANLTVPNNNVDVTIPGTAVRFCEINPNTSPYAVSYGNVARSANIIMTAQELRFGPSAPINSLLNVRGNLTIDIPANSYVNMVAGGEIEITGHWYNNRNTAAFDEGAGTVEEIGTAIQTINTVDTKETYNNLIINNTTNAAPLTDGDMAVTLNKPVDVAGIFTLINGRVLTSQTNLLTITNNVPAAVVGGEVHTYVNGPMARHTASTADYNFPVGKPTGPYTVYRPAIVAPLAGAANVYNSEYFATAGPLLPQRVMLSILNTEYWEIMRTTGSTPAYVRLYYINPNNDAHWSDLGPSTCGNFCNVAIAKNYAEAGNIWYFTNYPTFGGFSAAVPEVTFWGTSTLLSSKMVNSFSPFTFAFDYNTILTLPITLLRFDGKLQQTDAALNWKLADNDDLLAIDVEHSLDGRTFSKLGTVLPGASTEYNYLHKQIPYGANYYRLLLKDKNGTKRYSHVVQVNRTGNIITRIHGLKSNPVQNDALLNVTSAKSQMINWKLIDQQGKLMMAGKALVARGDNVIRLPMPLIPNGFFFLHASSEDGVTATLKLVKE